MQVTRELRCFAWFAVGWTVGGIWMICRLIRRLFR